MVWLLRLWFKFEGFVRWLFVDLIDLGVGGCCGFW